MESGKRRPFRIALLAGTLVLTGLVLGWYIGESRPGETVFRSLTPGTARAASAPLDLNTATAAELEELPGIGPVLAERIVGWRRENGPFGSPEDVTAVPGVGPALYEAMAPYICTEKGDGP